MKIRKAVFAGSWYPATASACEKEILRFLQEREAPAMPEKSWKGGIVPHAGWFYSGSIACRVIRHLLKEPADVIAIFGMHLHPGSSPFLMKEGGWETPFGDLPVDAEVAGELAGRFTFRGESSGAFARDNTIELQLPFIRYFSEAARIVPVGVPPGREAMAIGEALTEIATRLGRRLKVIGSTDLTHYGSAYGFAPRGTGDAAVTWVRDENDRKMIAAILAMDSAGVIDEALLNRNACCAGAVAAAIAAGRRLGADRAVPVAYATSHDKSPGDSLVGYAGMLF
jgi:MEMO1 family protein